MNSINRRSGLFFNWQYIILISIIIIQLVVFSILQRGFISLINIKNILLAVSVLGIASVSLGLLMVAGGIDISIGAHMGFSATVVAVMLEIWKFNIALSIILMLCISAIIGLINGIVITKFKVNAMITTIGMLSILHGIALVIRGGYSVGISNKAFRFLGWGHVFYIPTQIFIFIIIIIIGFIILQYTHLGRRFYIIGDNREAAILSGINADSIQIGLYVQSAVIASMGGMIIASQYAAGHPNIGVSFLFPIITAVILGGVSFTGGIGKVQGIILGVLTLGILEYGLQIIGVHDFYQKVAQGTILLIVIGIDQVRKGFKE